MSRPLSDHPGDLSEFFTPENDQDAIEPAAVILDISQPMTLIAFADLENIPNPSLLI